MRVGEARGLAEQTLSTELPQRWGHVRGVARQAEHVAHALIDGGTDLICAAWLHDIGYASGAADTGFHALDGARYLRRLGIEPGVCRLVAYHSGAIFEAAERGLDLALSAEFTRPRAALIDALAYCDMLTDTRGRPTTLASRLADVRRRYAVGHPVRASIDVAATELESSIRRTAGYVAAR